MADVEQILREALQMGDEGRWKDMAERLTAALEDAPDNAYVLCWLGVAEQELGNDGVAYDYFRHCLAQEPMDAHLLALAGAGLAAFDDPEAEAALRAAALSAPELPLARLQYGVYLARSGVFDEARDHLEAAVELAPDDPTTHGELGVALALEGEREAAAEAMERALRLAPDDAWTRVLLGLVYLSSGEIERAAGELVPAAEHREHDPEADILAALAAAATGQEHAAHVALARAEQIAEGTEARMVAEAEKRILSGPEAARAMLVDTLGPSVLRERLVQPG